MFLVYQLMTTMLYKVLLQQKNLICSSEQRATNFDLGSPLTSYLICQNIFQKTDIENYINSPIRLFVGVFAQRNCFPDLGFAVNLFITLPQRFIETKNDLPLNCLILRGFLRLETQIFQPHLIVYWSEFSCYGKMISR